MSLAAHEHVAVIALDAELPEPAYTPRFTTLPGAVIEGASNVLRGGWLAGRAGAFRHRKAWGHHPVALSHAIEAYVRGLRGDGDGCARAQPIVLTRLVRAAAAVAILDAVATASAAETGRSARGGRAG